MKQTIAKFLSKLRHFLDAEPKPQMGLYCANPYCRHVARSGVDCPICNCDLVEFEKASESWRNESVNKYVCPDCGKWISREQYKGHAENCALWVGLFDKQEEPTAEGYGPSNAQDRAVVIDGVEIGRFNRLMRLMLLRFIHRAYERGMINSVNLHNLCPMAERCFPEEFDGKI